MTEPNRVLTYPYVQMTQQVFDDNYEVSRAIHAWMNKKLAAACAVDETEREWDLARTALTEQFQQARHKLNVERANHLERRLTESLRAAKVGLDCALKAWPEVRREVELIDQLRTTLSGGTA